MKKPIDSLRSLLSQLGEIHSAITKIDLKAPNHDPFYYQKDPGWRSLVKLPGTYSLCIATLESVFEDELNFKNPDRLKKISDTFLEDIKKGKLKSPNIKSPIPQARDYIHAVTLRDALSNNLITKDEAKQLLSEKPWDKESFKIAELKDCLNSDLIVLTKMVLKTLRSDLRPTK